MHRYKDLKFWQLNRGFCRDIYKITETFPDTETFGLVSQLRRASVSISSNIAEGSSRNSNADFSRFLRMSLGSCYEVDTQLLLSFDLEFIKEAQLNSLQDKLQQIIKMISKFNGSLKS